MNPVILISAEVEWQAVLACFPSLEPQASPFGQFLEGRLNSQPAIFMQGGWGKIAAAASAQYAVDRWKPSLLVNLGTCGGLAGKVQRGQIILVTETVVYDIVEQMADPAQALQHFRTRLDTSWLPSPHPYPVLPAPIYSADRDILPSDVRWLRDELGALACDWESGAIAWVADRNQIPCLILRGVTDLVDEYSGEAYGNVALFHSQAVRMMKTLVEQLPAWLG